MSKDLRMNIAYWVFLLMPSTLFLPKIISSIFIIILAVLLVDRLLEKNVWQKVLRLPVICSLIYVGAHLISITYTQDRLDGLKHVQGIISFLLFPLFGIAISLSGKFNLNRKFIGNVLSIFILTATTAMFYCVGKSIYNVEFGNGTPSWWYYYRGLSSNINLHPVYFSYYLNLVLVSLLFSQDLVEQLKKPLIRWTLILITIGFSILLSSRTPLIVTVFIIGYFIFNKLPWNKWMSAAILLMALLISIFALQNNNRFKEISSVDMIKNMPRYSTWLSAIEVLKENWLFGLPYGDLDEALYNKYVENNYTEGIKFKYNCHNQYMQQLGYFGIIGLGFIFYWLFALFKQSNSHIVLFLLLISIIIYLLTENLFSVNKGIIFTSYFFTIMALYDGNTSK